MTDIRETVRAAYGRIATAETGCCGPAAGCCGTAPDAADMARRMGYAEADLAAAPEGANLGLGCGNPQAIADLEPGETVIDLGSGAGFDAFLAARAVGPAGRVVGVDMTPEMLAKARANAVRVGAANVEFRLGEIENLPLADACADVVISNCVINLSPDKPRVFVEAFRVLKPGGRLAVSDVVRRNGVPPGDAADIEALCGCVAGAASVAEIEAALQAAGFVAIAIADKAESRDLIAAWTAGDGAEDRVVSAAITARKP